MSCDDRERVRQGGNLRNVGPEKRRKHELRMGDGKWQMEEGGMSGEGDGDVEGLMKCRPHRAVGMAEG